MATATKLSSNKLSAFLKVDCFGAKQYIRYPGEIENRSVVSRPEFFEYLYSHVTNNNVSLRRGLDMESENVNYDEWINEITDAMQSVVVFIEGYAGCGKSVFVQKVLTSVFPDYEYDRSYYNYDCGTKVICGNVGENVGDKGTDKNDRIKQSILTQFISQYIALWKAEKTAIINKLEELLKQDEVSDYLDQWLSYEFVRAPIYEDIKERLCNGEDEEARSLLFDQLKCADRQRIIYIDCILRLAKYIVDEKEPETLMVCYDNLDAIEDNVALYKFDDELLTVKQNLNTYLASTQENYNNTGKTVPHFAFFATYRKITAVKAGIYKILDKPTDTERGKDEREKLENTYLIDGSHLYNYRKIIKNRFEFLKKHLPSETICSEAAQIIKQFGMAIDLFETEYAKTGFSELWNNNFRTCSDILGFIISEHVEDTKNCIELSKFYDMYDNRKNVASGASAILLSIIFRVQKTHNYWNKSHYNVSDLLEDAPTYEQLQDNPSLVHKLATLSRLIITYIENVVKYEYRPVSTKEIFLTFVPVYIVDDIAKALANLLNHDYFGIWRRPIVYISDVQDDDRIDTETKMRNQGYYASQSSKDLDEEGFSKLTICDCGKSYIKSISCDYEYYSARINKGKGNALYSAVSIKSIEDITNGVYEAVQKCYEKMKLFKEYYCDVKKCLPSAYLDLKFHPRTENGNAQLHTERVVFQHIDYLENYRHYIIHNSSFSADDKGRIREIILSTIRRYLDLYDNKIHRIDTRRTNVAEKLRQKLEIVANDPNDNTTRIQNV